METHKCTECAFEYQTLHCRRNVTLNVFTGVSGNPCNRDDNKEGKCQYWLSNTIAKAKEK